MIISEGRLLVGMTELRKNFNYFMAELDKDPSLAITITRYGKPVAVLISYKQYETLRETEEAIYEGLKEWRRIFSP